MKRWLYYIVLLFVTIVLSGLFSTRAYAQADNLAGTYGTEFWLGFLRNNAVEPENPTIKITIFAVAEKKVDIVVALGATGNQLGTISIPAGGGFGKLENVTPASVYPTKDEAESKLSKGVIIYSKDNKTKFSCYALIEAGANDGSTRDATLLLPKDLLDKEYFIQSYPTDTKSTEFVVVATEDETSISITPTTKTSKGTTAAFTVDLNKGQSYLVQSAPPSPDGMDLSGSSICSNKPIAVFTGNEATMIPNTGAYSLNHTFEQVIPQTMWGTDFYIALAGETSRNMFNVTSSYAGTKVTIKVYDRKNNKVITTEETITKAGGSLHTPDTLILRKNDEHTDVVIHADKPVLCYTYLTCGGVNTDDYDHSWGNPANALAVPWTHRAKEMSFYTSEIENQTDGAPQRYFIQIVTDKADDGKIVVDGTALPSTAFKEFGADNSMVYTNYELKTHGKHRITTVGQGFTGFVYGMTSESRAYQYTLGFDPPKYLDSLFIENKDNVMSPYSYDLPYMENQGWYQRQLVDFPIDEQRIDTAYVCDSTVLNFFGQLAEQNKTDEVIWKIYKCDKTGKKIEPAIKTINSSFNGSTMHKQAHQFIVDPQLDLPPEQRDPFTYYSVDMEKYKKHLICTNLPPDADTLRTMVRVQREYNDTTWRILCVTETMKFFKHSDNFVENLTGGGPNEEITFAFNPKGTDPNTMAFIPGKDNTWSRKYRTATGCDSIVTLKIFGCDTIFHRVDTTVCQDSLYKLSIKDDRGIVRFSDTETKFDVKTQQMLLAEAKADPNGKLNPYTKEYLSVLTTSGCLEETSSMTEEEKKILNQYKEHCKNNFKGCPDTFKLNLTIKPRLQFPLVPKQIEWCTLGDETATYPWKNAHGDVIANIQQTDSRFDENGIGEFRDTTWYDDCTKCSKCVMEIDILKLHIAKDVTKTVHICQNQSYQHNFGGTPSVTQTYYGKDYPVGVPQTFTKQITIGSGDEKCEYQSTLILIVHPSYSGENALSADSITCRDDNAFYKWSDHPKTGKGEPHRMIWMEDTKTHLKQKVSTDKIPLNVAGSYILWDSLKTTTCTECQQHACDSIWKLNLLIAKEETKIDSFGLCQDKELDYEWDNKHFYYYSDSYKGIKKTPFTILKTSDWLNKTCSDTKVYVDNTTYMAHNQYGCDSLHILKIHLDSVYVTSIDTFICETETYDFFGEKFKWDYKPGEANVYTKSKTVPTECHCDSGVTHVIHVRPAYGNLKDADETACQYMKPGDVEFYTWKDHPRDGEPARDIWMLNTATNKGKKVRTDQIPLNIAGTFTLIDSLKTKTCPDCKDKGCDSITSLQLTIYQSFVDPHSIQLSSESYWLWDDTLFLGGVDVKVPTSVTYTHKIVVPGTDCYTHYQHKTSHGCDSVVTWCIKVGEVFRDTSYAFVCDNCEYLWHIVDPNTHKTKDTLLSGAEIPRAGDTIRHYAKYKTQMDFDSIYTLILVGFPTKYNGHPVTPADAPETAEVCQGEDFNWVGHPGQRDELYIIKGGIATPIKTNTFIKTISQEYGEYLIRDSMVTDTLFYNTRTKTNEPVHCDSIWELKLTVHPTYTEKFPLNLTPYDEDLCSNEALLWSNRLWVGYDYDKAAHPLTPASMTTDYDSIIYIPKSANLLFKDSIVTDGSIFGCDSVSYLNIHISRYDTTWHRDHIGDNNTNWSFGGKGGTFSYNGKSKITRADLIAPTEADYKDPDRHDIYRYFFTDTLHSTLTGCDSIVWDSVYIHPSYRFPFDTLLCSNNDWDWRPESPNAAQFKNVNLWLTGTYYDSLWTEPWHIDSVYVLNLTIQPGAKHNFGANICKNDTLKWDGDDIYYRDNYTSITHTYKTGSECDSVLIFTPVFYEYYHFDTEHIPGDSLCRFDEYTWISAGETTPHTAALRGEKGEHFDAIPTDTFDISADGDTIGIWITIYDSLHTTAPCHCDSTYTLRYYVKPAFRYYEEMTICTNDTIEWRGQTLYADLATTIYTQDSYQTTGGNCDSIYYLTLHVNQAYDSLRYDTICGNDKLFLWEGHDLTPWLRLHDTDTLPSDTSLYTRYPTELGCDSIFRLELNVRPILTEEWEDTICVGETYALNDKRFTVTGVYADTLKNSFGCDSFAIVHLQVVPATKFTVEPMIICADNGAYDLVFAFDPKTGYQPREVKIVYDSLAQACGYPKDTVTLPVVGNIVAMELPVTDELYVRPNDYSAKIYFDNGTCDDPEMQRVDFHFTVDYPNWLLEQRWADAIGILAAKYNGNYTFSAYQWYKNGEKLVGETKPYYFAPQYLEVGAEYSVELTRADDSVAVMTCALTAVQRDNTLTPQKPYVSVVPTLVIKANPVVHILCSQFGGDFRIYNPYGSLIEDGKFTPGEHNAYEVKLPALSGMYLFELNQENGEVRTVKVIVE